MYISICLGISVNSSFHLHIAIFQIVALFKETCPIFAPFYTIFPHNSSTPQTVGHKLLPLNFETNVDKGKLHPITGQEDP